MILIAFLIGLMAALAFLLAVYRRSESHDDDAPPTDEEAEEIARDAFADYLKRFAPDASLSEDERRWQVTCIDLLSDPGFLSDIHLALEESPRWPQT